MNESVKHAAPVGQHERIIILDSLRGIAILGILLMNIPGFALPAPASYGDLTVLNEIGTLNEKVWYVIEMTFAGTQRALFSMLFGAGMILFISGKEKRLEGLLPAEYYFRRQLWLLVFGLFNAFVLLWFWDILFLYAICGMIIFSFRRLSPKALIIAAVVCLAFQTLRDNVDFFREKNSIVRGEMVAKLDTNVQKLTPDQLADLSSMSALKEKYSFAAKQKAVEKSIQKIGGDYAALYEYQSERSYQGEIFYTYFGLWDVLIFMFLGMAFYKTGIMTGDAPAKTYWLLFIAGIGLGSLLTWYRLAGIAGMNFDQYEIVKNVPMDTYELARTVRSIGIFGATMLLYKSGVFKWFFAMMRPVGQMAFTNYLAQSFLVGLFFYGIGFGMFGKLQRYEIYYVVAATWALEIIWSNIWLRYFRFGPMEWAWRSLTYWEMQPMKKS
ncbi:MAG TPA: DUF418 domain-containing protein [Chitinophagaceae bacterium]|nr:DUF418 domain-containing protein [Chitinophagaceae bacterium]